MTVLAGYTST